MFASSSFLLEEWLLRSTLAGGLLLLAGVAIMGSVAQPARRQRVGELALLSSLVVTGLCAFPAWMPYSVPLWPAPIEQVREQDLTTSDAVDDVEWVALGVSPEDLALLMELQMESSNAAVDVEGLPPAPAEEWLPPREVGHAAATAVSSSSLTSGLWPLFLAWVGWAYGIVLATLLVRFGLGYVGLWRWWRVSEAAPLRAQAVLRQITGHWRTIPCLRVCRRLATPVSFGLIRPTILVPPTFCRAGGEVGLRAVLVHELTHLERRDALSCILLAVAQALYFYLPWFWWLRRQVRLCQEYVADAAAAALTSSEDYAEYLMSLSSLGPQRAPASVGVLGFLDSSSDLFRRITMLLNPKLPVERRCPAWWSVGAASCFLAGAVFVSGIGLRAEAAPMLDDEDGKPARIVTQDVEVIVKGDKIDKDKVKVLKLKDVKENKVRIVQDGEEKELAVICVDCENCCQDDLKAKIAKAGGTDKVLVVEVASDGKPRIVSKTPSVGKVLKTDPTVTQAEVILREVTTPEGQLRVQAKPVAGQEVLWVAAVNDDEDAAKQQKQKAQEAEAKARYQRALRLTDAQTKEIQEALKKAQELAGKAGQQGLEDAKARLEQAAAELAKAKKMMELEVQKAKEQAEKSSQDAKKTDESSRKAAIEALIQAETRKAKAQGEKAAAEGQKAAESAKKAAVEAWAKTQKQGQDLRYHYSHGAAGGRLGIMLANVSDELRAHLDLGKDAGVLVVDVVDDSAAAKAGFQKHDIVVVMNNNAVGSDLQAFIKGVQEVKTGDKVSFVVLRKGKKTAIKEVTMPEAKAGVVYGVEGLKGTDGKKFEYKMPHVIQAVPGKDGKTFEWKVPEGFKFDDATLKKFEELKKLNPDGAKSFEWKVMPEGFKFDADTLKKFEELKKLNPDAAKHLEGLKLDGFKVDGSQLEGLKKLDPKVIIEKDEAKLAEKLKSAKTAPSKTSNVTTTTTIRDNSFTSRHQEGALVITVAGSIQDGKVGGVEIVINDGGKASTYTNVDKVPEQYREKVKNLLNVGEKGKIRVETKSRSDSDV